MEHNDETRIREKVRRAEELPQAWNKDHVRSAIFREGRQPRRPLAFYYVAASLTLAAALIYYTRQLTYREEINLKVKEIELRIVQSQQRAELTTPVQQVAVSSAECPDQPLEKISKPGKTRQAKPMLAKQNDAGLTQPADLRASELPKPEEVKIATEQSGNIETPDVSVASAPTQVQVQPIIGRIADTPATTRNKKFQVRFFQSDEEVKNSAPSSPLTTLASINNR